METIIVILIVGLAAVFICRNFYKKFNKKSNSRSCGCSSCPTDVSTCELPEAKEQILTGINNKSSK
jgi:hypothetical protein